MIAAALLALVILSGMGCGKPAPPDVRTAQIIGKGYVPATHGSGVGPTFHSGGIGVSVVSVDTQESYAVVVQEVARPANVCSIQTDAALWAQIKEGEQYRVEYGWWGCRFYTEAK